MSIKRLFVVLLVFVVLVSAFAYFAASKKDAGESKDGYAVYENAALGLKAEYPVRWQTLEDVRGVTVVFHSPLESAEDKYNDNVHVIVEDVSAQPWLTAEAYAASGVAKLPGALVDFRLIGNKSDTVSGRPARLIEYTGRRGDFQLHFLQAVTIADGKAFLITYVAEEASYAKHLPTAQRIFASVTIK
ncbi:MAG: PsbP-related protein [Sporomusaceae bacterium]|nr:PsbP-related protein [Sporomusaceae bacterium]